MPKKYYVGTFYRGEDNSPFVYIGDSVEQVKRNATYPPDEIKVMTIQEILDFFRITGLYTDILL